MELREEIRSEKERLRADNIMWEQQNSELEAERTRLLQALRTQGKQLVFVVSGIHNCCDFPWESTLFCGILVLIAS